MKNQLPVIAHVKGLGQIVEVCSEYHMELQQLMESGARLISPRDEAYTRLYTRNKEAIGIVYGTRTTGGFEYAKGQLPILRIHSRLNDLKLAKLAVIANKKRNYFHTKSTEEYEESMKEAEKDKNKDPEDRNVIVLPSRDAFMISDKQHWEIYEAVLKDQAKSYFEYNGPIPVYPIEKETVDSQRGTILNVLWFRSFEGQSIFYGFSRNLNHDDRARGVFNDDTENTKKSESNGLSYTTKQIDTHLEMLKKIKKGNTPVSKLKEIANFLEALKR